MRHLRSLKKLYAIDACIINGENSAEGNGITPESAQMLFDAGADVITTGNHVLKRREIYPLLEEEKGIIRPTAVTGADHSDGVRRQRAAGKV